MYTLFMSEIKDCRFTLLNSYQAWLQASTLSLPSHPEECAPRWWFLLCTCRTTRLLQQRFDGLSIPDRRNLIPNTKPIFH
jgi:hypothetical protein